MRGTISASSVTHWPGRYESGCGYDEDEDITYEPTGYSETLSNGAEATCTDIDGDICTMRVEHYCEESDRYLALTFQVSAGMLQLDERVDVQVLDRDGETVLHAGTIQMFSFYAICNLHELAECIKPWEE